LIISINEIDVFSKVAMGESHNDEHEWTLNQLLIEMHGSYWGKGMSYLTQSFLNLAWLGQDSRECHPGFYSLKNILPIHKY
jgi:hypothetical protein